MKKPRKTDKIHSYCPSYQGNHTYANYEKMKADLTKQLSHEDMAEHDFLLLDVEFLWPEEHRHYFYDIFTVAYSQCIPFMKIYIQAKDKKTLRRIRRTLRAHLIAVGVIQMHKGRYLLGIED